MNGDVLGDTCQDKDELTKSIEFWEQVNEIALAYALVDVSM